MKKALIAGLAIGVGSAASAQIQSSSPAGLFSDGHLLNTPAGPTLWDQQPDGGQPGFIDQEFGDFASFSTYTVSDVNFSGNVVITDITTYYTTGVWDNIGAATAALNIFSDDGSGLPAGTDDPTAGGSVAVNIGLGGSGFVEVTATGLNIALGAGDYWVGLTPELDFGTFGQSFLVGSGAPTGDASASRNPGGAFGIGPDWVDTGATFGGVSGWDGSITILGTPTPGTLALLGLGGLVAGRRRR